MEIRLRPLKEKDAPLMLEWMHDDDCVKFLDNNFRNKTIDDCKKFIKESQNSELNIHLAITDDDDVYLGTISLKNVDRDLMRAEFAIALRKPIIGTGVGRVAMQEIINIGFEKLELNAIYWYVLIENARAIRFYDKNGYMQMQKAPDGVKNKMNEKYIWYMIQRK